MRPVLRAAATVACALAVAAPLDAQLDPGPAWRTIRTTHFRVHFRRETERLARRAAVDVERAWTALAAELVPPRGTIDVVISDDVDFSNGYATTYPTNRIVVYAQPPVSETSLRFQDDWLSLVLTHELVHIFHLDRTRGLWRVGQWVFGRNPSLFPQQYLPRWVTEGLAVYYESKLTGSGRIEGTTHRMVVRAGLLDRGGFTRLDELSLATSRFPYGQAAYVYGSLLINELAARQPAGVRAFIERTAVVPVPFFPEPAARRAFGITLQEAWSRWRDSLVAASPATTFTMEGWREWRSAREYAAHPRWVDDSTIVLSVNDGRDVGGVERVTPTTRQRLARRNGLDANAPLPARRGFVFAQPDFVNPYQIRSDLYLADSTGERRLTRGARLTQPDVRADGRIVAVHSIPGGTEIVVTGISGFILSRLTGGSSDTTWSEPRWSPDGRQVAAARWRRGGYSAIVTIDAESRTVRVLHETRAVNGGPHWSPDGAWLVFSSDQGGSPQLYRVAVDSGAPEALSAATTGLFEPQVSPGGTHVAALAYRADGYSLGVAPLRPVAAPDMTIRIPQRSRVAVADSVTTASTAYRAWGMLLPRYWMPTGSTLGDGRTLLGGLSSASDILGRHSWSAAALFDLQERRVEGSAAYRFTGLRQPIFDFSYDTEHDYFPVIFTGGGAADTTRRALRRTIHTMSAAATIARPRIRTNVGLTVGGSREFRRFHANDDRLEGRLPAVLGSTPVAQSFPSLFVTGFFANPRRPSRAISLEDGISVSSTVRQRWLTEGVTRSLVGAFRGFRSLNLPGFAHHVLAVRAAGALADERATGEFSIGGVNGTSVEVVPGIEIGGGARTFPVRGFAPGTQYGLRAAGGSLEYRAPFLSALRGYRLLPLFFDRSSLTVFGDAASAWCSPATAANPNCVAAATAPRWVGSVGGELNLDAAFLDYDTQYRLRLGLAAPVVPGSTAPQSLSFFFTFGSNF